jgi:dCMP deaminase
MSRLSLDEYALILAHAAAQRSEDPKRRVGAAVLDERGHVLALGYNGPPPGVDLTPEQWSNAKALLVIHAEINALRHVGPGQAAMLATTYAPCVECLKVAAAQGVRRIVYGEAHTYTVDSVNMHLAAEAFGVELVLMPPWPQRPEE